MFLPLLAYLLAPLPIVAGDEIILGRIKVERKHNHADAVGPMHLGDNRATIFRELAERAGVDPVRMTSRRLARLLTDRELLLRSEDRPGAQWPAQWEPETSHPTRAATSQGRVVWVVDETSPPLAEGEYLLISRDNEAAEPTFRVEDREGKQLIVSYGHSPVLRYNYGIVRERPEAPGPYDRAGYIHPVWSPSGKIVTGDFSPEHIHQRGVFLAWRKARFGDVETDFWSLGNATGRVLPSGKPPQVIIGPVFTKLVLANQGVVDGKPVFDEEVELTVYRGTFHEGWLFDIAIQQRPVPGVAEMELPSIYYGGMSFRGPSGWLRRSAGDVQRALARGITFDGAAWLPEDEKLDVLTSEGKDRLSGDSTTAWWIDYTGPLGAGWGGLAVYDRPSSPRYPPPLRIHPELPYFSIALVQKRPLRIRRDRPLKLHYRFRAHDGPPNREVNERIAETFKNEALFTWRVP